MASREIEVILSRQLADSLSIPVFITDTEGALIFYNEPAGILLGRRFEDTGTMQPGEWTRAFFPQDLEGNPLPPHRLPLVQTLKDRTPTHDSFWIDSMTGERHLLSVTSIPIIGRNNRFLGAMAIFWKTEQP
ncbi:MAG: PAS domain-containing protein [Bacteroidota bacterium]